MSEKCSESLYDCQIPDNGIKVNENDNLFVRYSLTSVHPEMR